MIAVNSIINKNGIDLRARNSMDIYAIELALEKEMLLEARKTILGTVALKLPPSILSASMLRQLFCCETAVIQDLKVKYDDTESFKNLLQDIDRRLSQLAFRRASLAITACKLSLTSLRLLQRTTLFATEEEDVNKELRDKLTHATEQQV